jgi:transcriptional regulator with XRE-family HTH domain
MITSAQCRAARATLRWSLILLAERAQVGAATINRFETDRHTSIRATVMAIKRAFEDAGVRFTDEGCVCPPKGGG